MPTYEFFCQHCAKSFELIVPLSEYERKQKEGIRCPDCGGADVSRQLSLVQVQTAKKS